jgi:hypothetical protein
MKKSITVTTPPTILLLPLPLPPLPKTKAIVQHEETDQDDRHGEEHVFKRGKVNTQCQGMKQRDKKTIPKTEKTAILKIRTLLIPIPILLLCVGTIQIDRSPIQHPHRQTCPWVNLPLNLRILTYLPTIRTLFDAGIKLLVVEIEIVGTIRLRRLLPHHHLPLLPTVEKAEDQGIANIVVEKAEGNTVESLLPRKKLLVKATLCLLLQC